MLCYGGACGLHGCAARQTSAELVGDGVAPVLAKTTLGDTRAHRCLAAFVLGGVEQPLDAGDRLARVPERDDLRDAQFVLHQSVEDAVLAADLGVDAIVLSNHGGRQVDLGTVPLEILPEVVARVHERVEVYIDGGIMSGTDVVAALAFGAHGVLVGRAYLYGLMAGGEDGVRRVVDILEKEIRVTMQLIGARQRARRQVS